MHNITGCDPGASVDSQISRDNNIEVTAMSNTKYDFWLIISIAHDIFKN